MKTQTCPRCYRAVEVRHNGGTRINEHSDPWEFVPHTRPDDRVEGRMEECPGSRRNQTNAAGSW